MTRSYSIVQLGVGAVGSAVVQLVTRMAPHWQATYDIDLRYLALADSSAYAFLNADTTPLALLAERMGEPLAMRQGALPAEAWAVALERVWEHCPPEAVAFVDCASGPATTATLLAARTEGASVLLANKDPLVGPQQQFEALRAGSPHARSGYRGAIGMSATVGAGLPILRTLAALRASGDTITHVEARASGSLGYLCDRLSQDESFDVALRGAIENGYTEPDPRQDLSGFDVARKLLILARVAGIHAELTDVRLEGLTPPNAENLTRAEFLLALPDYHAHLADRVASARAAGRVLRYIGRLAIDASGAAHMSAGLMELEPGDTLARGQGPENVFVLRSARYDANPLTIAGPGAGVAVTAGAVVSDLCMVLEALR